MDQPLKHQNDSSSQYDQAPPIIGANAWQQKSRVRWAPWIMGFAVILISAAIVALLMDNNRQSSNVPVITVADSQTTDHVVPQNPESATETPPASEATTAPASKPTTQPAAPAKSPFSTPIAIDGNTDCQEDTLAALELIAKKAPTHYAVVTQNIGIIKCVSQGSGMEAYLNPPRYLAGDTTRNAGTVWYAGTIVHDAGHSKLYHDYLATHPGQAVPGDIWSGENAEAACLNAQYNALQQMGADQGTLTYVQNIISSEYWNIPYDQRWW